MLREGSVCFQEWTWTKQKSAGILDGKHRLESKLDGCTCFLEALPIRKRKEI